MVDTAPLLPSLTTAALTSQRLLPVVEPLATLLPAGGLVRGQVVAVGGVAAMSLALGLAVEATTSGSWLAIVDVGEIGLEAAEEFGIALQRIVRVDTDGCVGDRWAELLAATVDGFELVITRAPRGVNAGLARRIAARLKSREAVLILVGSEVTDALDPAFVLRSEAPRWVGVDDGAGYLRGRQVAVAATGRRIPRPRRAELWLPDATGTIRPLEEPPQ